MLSDSMIQLMQAGSLTMTLFAAILILVVTRNHKDPRTRSRVALAMIGLSLLLFAIPLYGEILQSVRYERLGSFSRIVGSILLPYGLYSLGHHAPSTLRPDGRLDGNPSD